MSHSIDMIREANYYGRCWIRIVATQDYHVLEYSLKGISEGNIWAGRAGEMRVIGCGGEEGRRGCRLKRKRIQTRGRRGCRL